jgi:hypothetical protein
VPQAVTACAVLVNSSTAVRSTGDWDSARRPEDRPGGCVRSSMLSRRCRRWPARLAMYESRRQPLLPRAVFLRRLLAHLGVAFGFWRPAGIRHGGPCALRESALIDAFLNSAMLLGGMGPVNPPQTPAGKLRRMVRALRGPRLHRHRRPGLHAPILHRVPQPFSLGRGVPRPNGPLRACAGWRLAPASA